MSQPPDHDDATTPDAVDYGDPALWREDAAGALAGMPHDVGWDWLGEDDLDADRGAAFSRAADEALTTGEELLARDLSRLRASDLELD